MTPSSRLTWVGRALRGVVVLGYVVWVVIGLCILRGAQVKPDTLQYKATKTLPAGHRLHFDDFTFSPLVPPGERNQLPARTDPTGKYLLQEKQKDTPFGPADVTAAPVMEVGCDRVKHLFSLKNQPDLAEALNTNSHVSVCSGDCPIDDARVLSTVCSTAKPLDCYAALELTKEDEAKLDDKIEYVLILRQNPGR